MEATRSKSNTATGELQQDAVTRQGASAIRKVCLALNGSGTTHTKPCSQDYSSPGRLVACAQESAGDNNPLTRTLKLEPSLEEIRAGPRPKSSTRCGSPTPESDSAKTLKLHPGGLRPAKALRSAAQVGLLSPPRRTFSMCEPVPKSSSTTSPKRPLSRQVVMTSPARLQAAPVKGRGVRDQSAVNWLSHNSRNCVPLTNMGRGLGHSESAPEVRPAVERSGTSDGAEGFVSELLPALPPGRMLRGSTTPGWHVSCGE